MTPNADELRAALEASGVGIWSWDLSTGEVRWSPQIEPLFGLERGAFGGTFEAFLAAIYEDDRAEVHEVISRALAEKKADFRTVHRVSRPGGEIGWLEGRGAVMLDANGAVTGMRGVCTDVTAFKELETKLRTSEENYRLITELASDYVYIVDLKGATDAISAMSSPTVVAGSFERTTGYTQAQIRERGGWWQIMLPEHRDNAVKLWDELLRGSPVVHEYRFVDGRGEIRWIRDRMRPILDPSTGKLVKLVGGAQDVTQRRLLEEQLVHAQKLEALARLAGGVAHDFNNLLLVIFAATTVLGEDPPRTPNRRTQALRDLQQAGERAAELTRSLLAFGRNQVRDTRPVPLHLLMGEARSIVEQAIGERVRLVMEPAHTEAAVRVDPGKIQLVLMNLVMNARDASADGAEVHVRCGIVTLDEHGPVRPPELAPGAWGFVEVEDHGVGMTAEIRRHLFEPFFTTKGVGRGTGLGLATAHGIVRQMAGAIGVRTAPGKGSTFTVYLPLTKDAAVAPTPPVRGAVGGTERVLLVEDEPAVRRVATEALRDRGYEVRELDCAEAALALADGEIAATDLLLTDVRLPGLDGTTLALRLSARFSALRVVLMSAYLEDVGQQTIASSERYLFLQKPFTPDGLASRVREALDRN